MKIQLIIQHYSTCLFVTRGAIEPVTDWSQTLSELYKNLLTCSANMTSALCCAANSVMNPEFRANSQMSPSLPV